MPSSSPPAEATARRRDSKEREVLVAQVRLLYTNANLGIGVTLLAATLLVVVEWGSVRNYVVIGWWLYMMLLSLWRCALAWFYRRSSQGWEGIDRWRSAFSISVGLAGVGWGTGGVLFYSPDNLTNQVFLVFVLGGMMLGAASLLASRPEAFLAFLLPTSLPVVARLLMEGNETHFAMALLAVVFTAATAITSGRIYRTVDGSLRLQFENRDLLEDLEAAKQQADVLNEALERKVEERTADLRSANEKLLRVNADLEQFAYSASHDLQEPLRSITIFSELLVTTSKEKLDGEALQALEVVRAGATRMELLLSGLLRYIRASQFELPREPIDAGKAYTAALENLAEAISESGATIHADALPSVRIHDTQMQQLFQNLIGNAIKYRKPGTSPVIDVSAERSDGGWRFKVTDNGIGIADEYKELVFGLFKRVHTQHEYTGSGIGLALCQRIVKHYQGRIWVESKSGEGSTFYFTLPA